MAGKKEKYILNPETLIAGLQEESGHPLWKSLLIFFTGIALFILFIWLNVSVWGTDLPKTAILRRRNADWSTRMDRISGRLDHYDELLSLLEVRDDKIYRSVYGMDEIPQEVRLSGFGGENRYAALEGTALKGIASRLDVLEKRAYIQAMSFDDVETLQRTAGDMAAHIPAIPPMTTEKGTYHLSSPFGYRSDPILGFRKRHTGMDFACPPGNPIYSVGDGVVIKVAHERKGYGNHVMVDHGFGYRTRYAHMSEIYVEVGQVLKRGDCLGLSGRSGRCTGPHLHFEVLYRNDYVNPALYMDLDMDPKDYYEMVRRPEGK
ncbi:MAG: M23 family metallopeptidase [Bacteroidales bacterium]|nr:M23 family metallopeptidase [Bacteroidales bacterium]